MRFRLLFILFIPITLSACNGREDLASQHGKPSVSRDYGYVIGDILPMEYRFELKGDEIDLSSLPPIGPVNEWLTVRAFHMDTLPHREGNVTRLHVEFQIFKGIKEPEALTIPPLTFRLHAHPESTVTTDPWSFTQVPVIPPDLSNESIEPHDGLGIGLIDVKKPSQRLAYWFTGTVIVVLLMFLRKYLQQRRYRPFQSAQSKIRAAFREGADPMVFMEGMRLMHRALDHTYGQTLFRRDIPTFLKIHPAFKESEEPLKAFFIFSGRLFFEPVPCAPEPKELFQLVQLLGQCVRAERGLL